MLLLPPVVAFGLQALASASPAPSSSPDVTRATALEDAAFAAAEKRQWFEAMQLFLDADAAAPAPPAPKKKQSSSAKKTAALNALGVSSRDMMAIFQSLKRSGALQADLVIN